MISDEPRSATAVALEDTTAEIIYPKACALLEKMAQEEEKMGRISPEPAQQQDDKEHLYD